MRGFQNEYVLKGVYLGLLVYLAQYQAQADVNNWQPLVVLAACTFGGLAVALIASGLMKLRQGYRIRGRVMPFILFLLLESPVLVYAGVIIGTLTCVLLQRDLRADPNFTYLVGGGAILGIIFSMLRDIDKRQVRLGLSLLLAALLVGGGVYFYTSFQEDFSDEQRQMMSAFLLLGVPVFYLLTFVGRQEESEVEVAATFGLFGLGLYPLLAGFEGFGKVALMLPVMLYFWYVLRVMNKIRVFKHVLRGISHARVGRYRLALLAYRRALQLEPSNELAQEGSWHVHVSLDPDQLANDPGLLELVDFDLCVERAGSLLLEKPTPEKMRESERLLDLVLSQRPGMNPQVSYWRAVAACHTKDYETAIRLLDELVDTDRNDPRDESRKAILLQAWKLSLLSIDKLRVRVGEPQLSRPGRRMEAIAAVERHWIEFPDDPEVWPMKRTLYQDLSEQEFEAAHVNGKAPRQFDYGYARQLGLQLIQDNARWQRGLQYLRMAAAGVPENAPSCLVQIAEVYQRESHHNEAWETYERAVQAGLAYEPAKLSEAEKQAFYGAVKLLGDRALTQEDLDAALAKFKIYSNWDRAGIETWRTIADIFERKGDAVAALRANEHALTYNSKDKDLLERKDRYYFSVMPEQVKANLETLQREMDVDYCLRKSRALLEHQDADVGVLDWVSHLVALAVVIRPESRPAKVLQARVRWRRGEIDEATTILEAIRSPKPERFDGRDDEDAWYNSCQLLGDLYLNNHGNPQKAIECFNDFRKSPKSGARTLYRLAQAYEHLGDVPRAVKCYQSVAAYTGNPLAPDAEEALHRLGAPTN